MADNPCARDAHGTAGCKSSGQDGLWAQASTPACGMEIRGTSEAVGQRQVGQLARGSMGLCGHCGVRAVGKLSRGMAGSVGQEASRAVRLVAPAPAPVGKTAAAVAGLLAPGEMAERLEASPAYCMHNSLSEWGRTMTLGH